MRNDAGGMVISAGNRDWSDLDSETSMTFVIDGGAPVTTPAAAIGPIVVTGVDESMQARLRSARELELTVPAGTFHLIVTGLGEAFDAAAECRNMTGE
jgi:hypothetical protein